MRGRAPGFGTEQFDDAYPDGIELHYWNQCRNRLVETLIRRHAGGEKVVDIGCGRGIVVDFLCKRGIDAWGCDLANPEPITDAIGPHLETGRDAVEADCSVGARCGLILDVLEHLADPGRFLVNLVGGLPDLALLIVTVPARSEIWSAWDDAYGHYRRYGRAGLAQLLADAGLELVESSYFFHSLYLAARVVGGLGRARPTEARAPATELARLGHRTVGAALALEGKLVPAWVFGSSLYAVARVPSKGNS